MSGISLRVDPYLGELQMDQYSEPLHTDNAADDAEMIEDAVAVRAIYAKLTKERNAAEQAKAQPINSVQNNEDAQSWNKTMAAFFLMVVLMAVFFLFIL
jgi:hypothetical protein